MAFHDGPQGFPDGILRSWPRAGFFRNDKLAARTVEGIFQKKTGMRVFVRGTAFQLTVWRALLQVPEGSLTSYSRIASAIGNPRAGRAVGTACGANPVAWLIPCHRVIHESGAANGYRWGTERKIAMIARESPAAGCPPPPIQGLRRKSLLSGGRFGTLTAL
jgi:AraC family transcriptional regulator of adaptative response/methylated-DNA-[protein]-cysteine methyltransferase